jgi:farnesyl-diphosphate farnesyltransferase
MADLQKLLAKTSRTFALSIPLLEEPLRAEVGVAYLLFRIADTFEDAARWPRAERLEALADLAALLRKPDPSLATSKAKTWLDSRPCDEEFYLELLAEAPAVLAHLDGLAPASREAIVRQVLRTVLGMADFVRAGDAEGRLRLTSLDDLRRYCYVVAGIVGELLTELFLLNASHLSPVHAELEASDATFGEGLQLVNILKDSLADARDGRSYLPAGLPRQEVLAVARADLAQAARYVLCLQEAHAPRGIVEFTALPVLLAFATLDELEKSGPGAKISRVKVAALMGKLRNDAQAGTPVISLAAR